MLKLVANKLLNRPPSLCSAIKRKVAVRGGFIKASTRAKFLTIQLVAKPLFNSVTNRRKMATNELEEA